jgi:hypothetical protein
LFVIEFAASCRDCHCGRTLQALILCDPLALNVRLKTETSGQVAALFFRHRSANRTIEIERRIISHSGFFTAFRPAMMVNFEHFAPAKHSSTLQNAEVVKTDHLSFPELCRVVASTSSHSESAQQQFKPLPPNHLH